MRKQNSGNIIVISGFSGSGKSSICKGLLDLSDQYVESISVTTREPRDNEKDGKDYFFVSKEEFNIMRKNGKLIESAEYCGNYYGTPYSYVQNKLSEGRNVLIIMETKGAQAVKEIFPTAILIFVLPPSIEVLQQRLKKRGDENAIIEKRMESVKIEASEIPKYDYIVKNVFLDKAIIDVHNIVRAEKQKTSRNLDEIESFMHEKNWR